MATKNFDQGALVRVYGVFTNSAGTAIDPTTVKIAYRADAIGTTTIWTYGTDAQVIRSATGTYYADIDTNESPGRYEWNIYSTGTGQAADNGDFYIRRVLTTPAPPSDPMTTLNGTNVTFLQTGTGAQTRSVRDKLREVQVSVKDFGAVGDGVTDDTTAFRNAYTVANTGSSSSSQSTGQSDSKPTLWLPHGIYKITGAIDNGVVGIGMRIHGDNAIIELAAGITFLDNIRYFLDVEGITIRGGAKHFAIKTTNLECQIFFRNCQFMSPTSRIFDIDATSQSTQLVVRDCRLFTEANTGAQVIVALSGDYIVFRDCFVKTSTAAAAAFEVTGSHLTIEGMVGVPATLYAWIELKGASRLYSRDNRYGGETSGASFAIVINRVVMDVSGNQTPTFILMTGDEAYTTGTLVYFYALPDIVHIDGVTGLSSTPPFKADSAVTAADLSTIGGVSNVFHINYNATNYGRYINPASASAIAREGLPLVEDRVMLSSLPNTADLVLQSGGNTASYGPTTTNTNTTLATDTDLFAVPIRRMTATADNGLGSWYYTTALNGFAAGVYTACFDIELTTSTAINVLFRASNNASWKQFTPSRGKHTICVPFYYDGTGTSGYLPKSIAIDVSSMPNTAVLEWHRFRIYHGRRHLAGPTVEVFGTAAPTSGQWYRGDRVFNSAKTTYGAPDYWTCFVAGTPGTWGANIKTGTFTMDNAATKTITEAEHLGNGVVLIPTNAAAAVLQGGAKHLYHSGGVVSTSFSVATADGTNAAGTENFTYLIRN